MTPAEQAAEILAELEECADLLSTALGREVLDTETGSTVAAVPTYAAEDRHGSLLATITLARSLVSALEADGWRP